MSIHYCKIRRLLKSCSNEIWHVKLVHTFCNSYDKKNHWNLQTTIFEMQQLLPLISVNVPTKHIYLKIYKSLGSWSQHSKHCFMKSSYEEWLTWQKSCIMWQAAWLIQNRGSLVQTADLPLSSSRSLILVLITIQACSTSKEKKRHASARKPKETVL